jgi:hypothetical protein
VCTHTAVLQLYQVVWWFRFRWNPRASLHARTARTSSRQRVHSVTTSRRVWLILLHYTHSTVIFSYCVVHSEFSPSNIVDPRSKKGKRKFARHAMSRTKYGSRDDHLPTKFSTGSTLTTWSTKNRIIRNISYVGSGPSLWQGPSLSTMGYSVRILQDLKINTF